MPSFHAVTTWIRRNGASGALENVNEVLRAREASRVQIEHLAERIAMSELIAAPLAA